MIQLDSTNTNGGEISMDLRRLQVFTKVYECKSFSRAADEVLLSQPTVSGHIKSLEEFLGIRLFDRLGREIMPTRGADLLYGHAKRILAQVDEASGAMDAFLGLYRGKLRIGGSTIPGEYILPAVLGRFHQLHPKIQTTLFIGDTGQIADKVLEGELEAGMVGAAWDHDKLIFEAIMEDQVSLAAWPSHPLAGSVLTIKDLTGLPIILRKPSSGTHMFVGNILQKAGLELGDLKVAARMGSTMALMQGVRAKVGVGFLSRRAMVDDLAEGRLIELKVKDLDLKRLFYLVTRKDRTHSPAAQAFLDLCRESAEDTPT